MTRASMNVEPDWRHPGPELTSGHQAPVRFVDKPAPEES
jgi:hypothetical protein